jgi:hypothetical protein
MFWSFQAKGNSPTQNTTTRIPTSTNPSSSQDTNDKNNEDSKRHITFTAWLVWFRKQRYCIREPNGQPEEHFEAETSTNLYEL